MIEMPNRLVEIREKIENGEPVDYSKYCDLVTLDIAIAGQEFVTDAGRFWEKEDDRIRRELEAARGGNG